MKDLIEKVTGSKMGEFNEKGYMWERTRIYNGPAYNLAVNPAVYKLEHCIFGKDASNIVIISVNENCAGLALIGDYIRVQIYDKSGLEGLLRLIHDSFEKDIYGPRVYSFLRERFPRICIRNRTSGDGKKYLTYRKIYKLVSTEIDRTLKNIEEGKLDYSMDYHEKTRYQLSLIKQVLQLKKGKLDSIYFSLKDHENIIILINKTLLAIKDNKVILSDEPFRDIIEEFAQDEVEKIVKELL